jgi:hypothetical protein
MNLENFEYTPTSQPVADDPVIFTLRPLDQRGYVNMVGAQALSRTRLDAQHDVAIRYIAGWRGGGQGAVTDPAAVVARLAEVVNAKKPNVYWMAWLTQIAKVLSDNADPGEEDAKKF